MFDACARGLSFIFGPMDLFLGDPKTDPEA
jgi:hypothetical protein